MPHLYCPPIWNQAPSPFRPENYKSRPSCLGLAANTKPGQSTFGLLGYWTGTRSNAVFGNCTTRLRNTHRTEEREVLYPWHPWSGCLVRIHEVVEKAAGDVVRCSHAGDPLRLWQELPVWMLDRAACAPMRVEAGPQADVVALQALRALLTEVCGIGAAADLASSNAPGSGATRVSHDQNRREAHATPAQSSSSTSEEEDATVRSVRGAVQRRRGAKAGVADPAHADPRGADGSDGAADPRPRRGSLPPPTGGAS